MRSETDYEQPKKALLEALSREFAQKVTQDSQTTVVKKITLLQELLNETDFAMLNLSSMREVNLFLFTNTTEAAYLLASQGILFEEERSLDQVNTMMEAGGELEYIFNDIILSHLVEMKPRKILALLASIGQARVMQTSVLPDKERK